MRRPHDQQRPRPHPFQHRREDLPLLLARSAHERRDIHDVETGEVVSGAAGAVAAERHGCFWDGEPLAELGRGGDGVEAPVDVEDEGLLCGGRG